jgi:DNA (cytosine-5)-methyltransferase 1
VEDSKKLGLLPTPNTLDSLPARTGEARERQLRRGGTSLRTSSGNLREDILTLLPTTRVSMAKGATAKEVAQGNPKSRIEAEVLLGETSWGKFAPAIERWEKVIGRKAPAPTKADGKDGSHRLSSLFTEFLMGLPLGWVTGHNLSRAEELKMCGNGVVPQQAEMALRFLIDDKNFK